MSATPPRQISFFSTVLDPVASEIADASIKGWIGSDPVPIFRKDRTAMMVVQITPFGDRIEESVELFRRGFTLDSVKDFLKGAGGNLIRGPQRLGPVRLPRPPKADMKARSAKLPKATTQRPNPEPAQPQWTSLFRDESSYPFPC